MAPIVPRTHSLTVLRPGLQGLGLPQSVTVMLSGGRCIDRLCFAVPTLLDTATHSLSTPTYSMRRCSSCRRPTVTSRRMGGTFV
jgi:hypothetical protein